MAMDRGMLEKQLYALGESSSWWEQREMRDLPAVLQADEEIRAIARGAIGRVRVPLQTWLLVVTDQRLLCLRSGRSSWRQLELGVHQITSVTLRMKLFAGRMLVRGPDRVYRFHLPHLDARKFSAALARVANCGQDTHSGPTQMIRRVFNHVLALPNAVFSPAPPGRDVKAISAGSNEADQRVHMMEERIQELQQQVEFLEQLLRQRQAAINAEPELQSSAEYR